MVGHSKDKKKKVIFLLVCVGELTTQGTALEKSMKIMGLSEPHNKTMKLA